MLIRNFYAFLIYRVLKNIRNKSNIAQRILTYRDDLPWDGYLCIPSWQKSPGT